MAWGRCRIRMEDHAVMLRRVLLCGLLLSAFASIAAAQGTGDSTQVVAAAGTSSSMFSNLANPAIGMNALFSVQAAHNLPRAYGLQFDEAEISLLSVVDPWWTF